MPLSDVYSVASKNGREATSCKFYHKNINNGSIHLPAKQAVDSAGNIPQITPDPPTPSARVAHVKLPPLFVRRLIEGANYTFSLIFTLEAIVKVGQRPRANEGGRGGLMGAVRLFGF